MILVFLVMAAIMAMMAAWLLPLIVGLHRAAHLHFAFAWGVMPLIMGAMMHFSPVLTRTRSVEPAIERLALLAWAGGALIVAFFVLNLHVVVREIAAITSLIACALLAAWQVKRGRAALGGAHPGLNWYLAALFCLGASLLAVVAMSLWPRQILALKHLHLHLNLFGFVGLAAIGTLQVLLPTVAGRPDAAVASRLRSDLPLALAGTLLIALGAAWLSPLSWAGLLLWLVPLARLAGAWLSLYRGRIFCRHGAAPLLGTALLGFAGALLAGALHGAGRVESAHAGHWFVFVFLFPLVSGAAGQLLPLWLRPGPPGEWHDRSRRRLTYGSGMRALLLLAGGSMALAGVRWSAAFALAGLLPFALLAMWVGLQARRA